MGGSMGILQKSLIKKEIKQSIWAMQLDNAVFKDRLLSSQENQLFDGMKHNFNLEELTCYPRTYFAPG